MKSDEFYDTILEAAQAKIIKQLKTALAAKDKQLKLYGDHLDSCAVRWSLESPKWKPCDCGLAQALKGGGK